MDIIALSRTKSENIQHNTMAKDTVLLSENILNKIERIYRAAKSNFTRRETRLWKGGQICFASVSICIIIKFISFHFVPFYIGCCTLPSSAQCTYIKKC